VLQLMSQLNRSYLIGGQCEPLLTTPELSTTNNATAGVSLDVKRPILRNIHLVMIGDSFMRYQYLSLAYRLRYGVWFHESMWYYNLVQERSFESPYHPFTWAEFMLQTNKILQPLEVCDCFRRAPNKFSEIIENRYFYDPVHNNSLIFMLAFGHVDALKGRLLPSQTRNVSSTWQMEALRERKSNTWIYRDWSRMVTEYIRALDPPPKHVIMNAGMWSHKFGWSQPPTANETGLINFVTKSMLRSIKKASPIQFGWRTTTYTLNRTNRGLDGDNFMCSLLPTCINVSFTRNVRPNYYWDGKHFLEPVYRAQNEEMLHILGYLPNDYLRLNLSQILE
jgi:hypothetical protein